MSFKNIKGIEVFDNGASRIWRCAPCEVWNALDEQNCCICKRKRPVFDTDVPLPVVHIVKAA